jgi:hypothetical protein
MIRGLTGQVAKQLIFPTPERFTAVAIFAIKVVFHIFWGKSKKNYITFEGYYTINIT